MKTLLATEVRSDLKFQEIILHLKSACNLTEHEANRLKTSNAAELLAAIPYIAGCKNPLRLAIAHLATFMADLRCSPVFDHQRGESLPNASASDLHSIILKRIK